MGSTSHQERRFDNPVPRLALHIGYPKTATSFLQRSIFPHCDSMSFIHKSTSKDATKDVIRFLRNGDDELAYLRDAPLSQDMMNVLSEENIILRPLSIWEDRKLPRPKTFARRLSSLAERICRSPEGLKVIASIRRQDTWLASRYAESAKMWESPSQDDFESRIDKLLGERFDDKGVWLDYRNFLAQLSRHFHRDQLLVLMLEDLSVDPYRWADQLEDFLGVSGLRQLVADLGPKSPRKNSLSRASDRWRLRDHEKEITLTPALSEKIMARYRESNRRLAKDFQVDGAEFDYY